jgi:hypothetical protein
LRNERGDSQKPEGQQDEDAAVTPLVVNMPDRLE